MAGNQTLVVVLGTVTLSGPYYHLAVLAPDKGHSSSVRCSFVRSPAYEWAMTASPLSRRSVPVRPRANLSKNNTPDKARGLEKSGLINRRQKSGLSKARLRRFRRPMVGVGIYVPKG
jgi:hypothetical protein